MTSARNTRETCRGDQCAPSAPLALLTGPKLPSVRCPMCSGRGVVALNAVRLPRPCPTCRGVLTIPDDQRYDDGFDFRAAQLGLAPRRVVGSRANQPSPHPLW